MGVEFGSCDVCHGIFADCGEWYSCDCGGVFCSFECAKMDYSVYDENGEGVEDEDGPGTCVLCRGEAIADGDLIEFLLKKCSLTREQASDLFYKEKFIK